MSTTASTEIVSVTLDQASRPRRNPARRNQRGMTTAEYAVGTCAAAGFAGVLLKILTDPQVRDLLLKFVLWLLNQFMGLHPF